jgi:hypothetical protein
LKFIATDYDIFIIFGIKAAFLNTKTAPTGKTYWGRFF